MTCRQGSANSCDDGTAITICSVHGLAFFLLYIRKISLYGTYFLAVLHMSRSAASGCAAPADTYTNYSYTYAVFHIPCIHNLPLDTRGVTVYMHHGTHQPDNHHTWDSWGSCASYVSFCIIV
jgi:hypothetical protein